MDTGLKGKTVLIAGASVGMGRMAALAFAQEGANLVLCTSTKMDQLREVAELARAKGVKVQAEQCDITRADQVQALVKASQSLGGVDASVNLAGYRCEGKLFDIEPEAWARNIEVNLTGTFNICRAVLPGMVEKKWGRIINIAGQSSFIGRQPAKAMVKLGIIGFTRAVAREYGPHNITANCVGPGTIAKKTAPGKEQVLLEGQPIPRKGTPEECISALVYLASDNAGFVTGQCWLVNGGAYFQ